MKKHVVTFGDKKLSLETANVSYEPLRIIRGDVMDCVVPGTISPPIGEEFDLFDDHGIKTRFRITSVTPCVCHPDGMRPWIEGPGFKLTCSYA